MNRTETITAENLTAGDLIIGDRSYPDGTLHLSVDHVSTMLAGSRLLVTVHAKSGPYGTERTISYADGEKVTVTR